MNLHTPEALATLPDTRLFRRRDAIRRLWRLTPSDNTASRAQCRLSVLYTAIYQQIMASDYGEEES